MNAKGGVRDVAGEDKRPKLQNLEDSSHTEVEAEDQDREERPWNRSGSTRLNRISNRYQRGLGSH